MEQAIAGGILLAVMYLGLGALACSLLFFALFITYGVVREYGALRVFGFLLLLVALIALIAFCALIVYGLFYNCAWVAWITCAFWSLIALGFAGAVINTLRTPEGRAELRYIWTGTKAMR
jgi:ethanolamine transporter EutH